MKYLNYAVTFREFPDEIALCINITNCPHRCYGCHSPELWEDVGNDLNIESLSKLIESNKGITCVGFMGGDADHCIVNELASYVKINYNLKVGWYSGGNKIPSNIDMTWFDYIKIGSYIEEKGGLDNPNTNQIMLKNITYKFYENIK